MNQKGRKGKHSDIIYCLCWWNDIVKMKTHYLQWRAVHTKRKLMMTWDYDGIGEEEKGRRKRRKEKKKWKAGSLYLHLTVYLSVTVVDGEKHEMTNQISAFLFIYLSLYLFKIIIGIIINYFLLAWPFNPFLIWFIPESRNHSLKPFLKSWNLFLPCRLGHLPHADTLACSCVALASQEFTGLDLGGLLVLHLMPGTHLSLSRTDTCMAFFSCILVHTFAASATHTCTDRCSVALVDICSETFPPLYALVLTHPFTHTAVLCWPCIYSITNKHLLWVLIDQVKPSDGDISHI